MMPEESTLRKRHPELFEDSKKLSSREHKREVPMKVLALGMPRSGTASMQLALNILGYPCYHGVTLIANLRDTEMWNQALDAKFFNKGTLFTRSDWDQLLGSFSAVTDLPAVAFAEDLLQCYPDAKVVLVKRDIEKWYRSFDQGIILNVWSPIVRLIARLDPTFVGSMNGTAMRWTKGWMGAHSRKEMQEKAREKYKAHYSLVERVTSPERLLKFELADGWGPLCEFLGEPVPDVQFPHTNESAALNEKIYLIIQIGLKNAVRSLAKFLLPLLVVTISWWVIHRQA